MARARERAAATGERMNWSELARRMVRHLPPPRDPREKRDPASVERILRDLRAGKREWRADYLEAISAVLGTHPTRLTADSYDDGKVAEATVATFLTRALGRRLEPRQARVLVSNLHRELDRPGTFELMTEIAEAVLSARSRAEAIGTAIQAIQQAPLWTETEEPAGTSKPRRTTGDKIRK